MGRRLLFARRHLGSPYFVHLMMESTHFAASPAAFTSVSLVAISLRTSSSPVQALFSPSPVWLDVDPVRLSYTHFPFQICRASMPDGLTIPRTAMSTETIIVETRGRVGVIRLNRPQALNALNLALKDELLAAVEAMDADAGIGCILIAGSDKAFAAGADIKEMADKSYIDIFSIDYAADYERLARVRKPIVAAVAGFALGGGCELAMMCDFIIAADNAKFGQPEIKLGVIPGIGGTQRLTRAVGKAKAMDLILTGRMMDAAEAERSGLVARVVPVAGLMEEAMKAAEAIASMSLPSVLAAKEAVNRSFETTLAEGVRFERRVFHALFATKDQKEGMTAFIEKRPAKFRNE